MKENSLCWISKCNCYVPQHEFCYVSLLWKYTTVNNFVVFQTEKNTFPYQVSRNCSKNIKNILRKFETTTTKILEINTKMINQTYFILRQLLKRRFLFFIYFNGIFCIYIFIPYVFMNFPRPVTAVLRL